MRASLLALGVLAAGCAESLPEPAPDVASVSHLEYGMPSAKGAENDGVVANGLLVPAARVLILDAPSLERRIEALGTVDVREEPGQHGEALEALRRQAAARGADAVVGVELHEGAGGQTAHLSGVAVRFLPDPD